MNSFRQVTGVEVLALQRRDETERSRLAAAGLTEVFRTAVLRTADPSPVQVVRGREAIARKLGVSQRTVERRMWHIMDRLGAQARFQAGLQAAAHGLLADSPDAG